VPGVLAWMDLEMTGLDPQKHVIVEIATLITDDELNIVAEGPDLVVHQPEEALALMEPIVVDMHTKSGLLDAIRSSTITLEQAGNETLAFIKTHVPEARKVPLCGNSIGMDRRFLDQYLPDIEHWLHYRSIDVSSVKELVRRWYPSLNSGRPYKAGTHRALDDIRESVAEMRFYRERVFVPSTNHVATAATDAAAPTAAAVAATAATDAAPTGVTP
jgi:oligoribonuclease